MMNYGRLCLPIYSRERRAQWGVPEDGTILFLCELRVESEYKHGRC